LTNVIQSKQAGDDVTLTILRGGDEKEVVVTLAERPQD
jgi:S1-C subfamily serine protease